MPATLHFYRDVLGFEVWASSEPGDNCNWCGLRLQGAEVMLNTAYEAEHRPAVPDPARIASYQDTCLFFGCEDLDGAYRHLREHGVDLQEPKIAAYGMRQLWFKDPDGYGLCFQWPVTQKWQHEGTKPSGIESETVS